jgi:hypothetical protein
MTAAAIALLIAAMMDGKPASPSATTPATPCGPAFRRSESPLKSALADKTVRACAARDLREAARSMP